MTKQEQIEEMAKMIDDRLIEANLWLGSMNKGKGYWIAEKLVEHYQPKLPEDSVVILREEYERLKRVENEKDRLYEIKLDLENQLIEKGWTEYEGADEIEKRVSKETAKKIFKMLISKLESNQFLSGKRIIMEVDVENLAKQFDVEIE